jgi:hypothetical protein
MQITLRSIYRVLRSLKAEHVLYHSPASPSHVRTMHADICSCSTFLMLVALLISSDITYAPTVTKQSSAI